jgi:hypothetical protein
MKSGIGGGAESALLTVSPMTIQNAAATTAEYEMYWIQRGRLAIQQQPQLCRSQRKFEKEKDYCAKPAMCK